MKIINAPQRVQIGQEIQLSVEPSQEVTWLSSDERFATVSSDGLVETRLVGFVEITAINTLGESDSVFITIVDTVQLTSLSIEPKRVVLTTGQTYPLSLNVTPVNADQSGVRWSSSRTNVLTIHGTIVTALMPGTSIVTANDGNGLEDSIRVEVLPFESGGTTDDCSTEKVNVNKTWLKTDRVYSQYRTKPKAVKWFNITRELGFDIYESIQIIRQMYCIERNSGAQLDIIGRILGASRQFDYEIDVQTSTYAPDGEGAQYGNPESMYASGIMDTQGNMGDDLYRLVLKARIVKNNRDATYDDILRTFNVLFPKVQNAFINDFEDMSYDITYVSVLSDLERWALLNVNLLPKPAGVRLRYFVGIPFGYVQAGDENRQFGDSENSQFATAVIN